MYAGNGKSIFYAYFIRRYSVEQPLVTVITASYTQVANDDILTNVVVWRGGKVVDEASIDESATRQLMLDSMRGAKDRVLSTCAMEHHLVDALPISKWPVSRAHASGGSAKTRKTKISRSW